MKRFLLFLNLVLLISSEDSEHHIDFSNTGLTIEEIDRLLFCGMMSQYKINQDENKLGNIAKEYNISHFYELYDKIRCIILYKCMDLVDNETVSTYFKNGRYHKQMTKNDFDNFKNLYEVDYEKFKDKEYFKIKDEEKSLLNKFKKAYEIHYKVTDEIEKIKKQRQGESREEKIMRENKIKEERRKEQEKIKDIENKLLNLPDYVRSILFFVVIAALFGGCLYFVNLINNKNKSKKDKKKKKKNQ